MRKSTINWRAATASAIAAVMGLVGRRPLHRLAAARMRVAIFGLVLAATGVAAAVPSLAATTTTSAARATTAGATTAKTATAKSVSATAQKAATPPDNCPKGDLCGYTGANYVGNTATHTEGELADSNADLNEANSIWNQVDSIWNNGRTDHVQVFRGENYNSDGGHVACLNLHTGFNNMQAQLPGLYHHIWSNKWGSGNC
jgi:hypothetical protein